MNPPATKPGLRAALRAVIYARVSADDQRERRSVGEQEQEQRDVCANEGWRVVRVFADNDRSASRFAKKEREQYAQLLRFLQDGNADILVLWESSRGSRELVEWAELLRLCRSLDVQIHVVTHGRTYDLENPRDWRTLAEDGVDSAYESEKTRFRVMRAVRNNARTGRPHGKLLYGYERKYDGRGKFVAQVIREDQGAVIREAAQRVVMGEPCNAIAQDFNNRTPRVPTPRAAVLIERAAAEEDPQAAQALLDEAHGFRWDLTQIRRLVTNAGYVGKRVHQGKTVGDAVWPAILDEETWQACVDRLSDPARKSHRDTSVKHLLSGIATCGVCNAVMRVQKNRGYLSYICAGNFCVSVKQDRLDEYVSAQVKKRLVEITEAELDDPDQEAARLALKVEADELQSQLEEARQQFISPAPGTPKLSAATLALIESDLQPKIDDLLRRYRAPKISKLVRVLVATPEKWDNATMIEKRELLRSGSVVDGIDVLKIGRGLKSYDIADRTEIHWVESRLSMNPHD
ncbi:recombinase family protein [Micromonospora aurantiaca (nom. illeg.)]|uniref:recombinase family protein n=1 Tax=Micromonospora aurantiaca (nom. illeg.) TaxID=47850 RepID=UPI0036BC7C61